MVGVNKCPAVITPNLYCPLSQVQVAQDEVLRLLPALRRGHLLRLDLVPRRPRLHPGRGGGRGGGLVPGPGQPPHERHVQRRHVLLLRHVQVTTVLTSEH